MAAISEDAIPYHEYRIINTLLKEHRREHEGKLRAFIVFGDFLYGSGSSTSDIQILEVVTNWQGPAAVSFAGNAELQLRGRLSLFFLTPEQFAFPDYTPLSGVTWTPGSLLQQVRSAYNVFYEDTPGYVTQMLERPDSGEEVASLSIADILQVSGAKL